MESFLENQRCTQLTINDNFYCEGLLSYSLIDFYNESISVLPAQEIDEVQHPLYYVIMSL